MCTLRIPLVICYTKGKQKDSSVTPDVLDSAVQLQLVHMADRIASLRSAGDLASADVLMNEAACLAECADDLVYQWLYIPVNFGQPQ